MKQPPAAPVIFSFLHFFFFIRDTTLTSIDKPAHNIQIAQTRRRRTGLLLSALSAVAFAVMTLLVRKLTDAGVTSLQIMFWRSLVQSLLAIPSCLALGISPLRMQWVLVRAVFGGIGHMLYYYALANLPMGVATVLFFTNPLFTALLRLLAHARRCVLAGIALIVKPTMEGVSPWALPLQPLAYVSIRLAGPSVHALVHVVYFGLLGMVGSAAVSFFNGETWVVPVTFAGWAVVLGVGAMAFLAQFLMNSGLQMASAGAAVMMRNSDIAITFVLDIVLFGVVPDIASVAGAFLISLAVILMSL
ncbi:hypothetical protein DL89DRAFT_270460 [Linderina pennispora]|uniref:EamA domain-containing protein n=1 Tax=Linderina pennispora TaxID=61395 RepID=A0A1Y1VY07_9FUNG|nr:uncharacterized protein DL89DRAFT_270460 [Linderina pennispora]ORX65896.1 hypothetical protein DL89DRAFT_270460 [Linderina pennispora]